jgi:hypothetical protein
VATVRERNGENFSKHASPKREARERRTRSCLRIKETTEWVE